MNSFSRLLAKRSETPDHPRPSETLAGHLALVGRVAARVVDDQGRAILSSLGLDPRRWEAPLREAALLGALLHDLGKANDQFQATVRGDQTPQAFRHDVVALWLLTTCGDLARWLFDSVGLEVRYAVVRAVSGHHLRFRLDEALQARPSGRTELRILSGHPDFAAALCAIGAELGRPAPPALADVVLPVTDQDAFGPVLELLADVDGWWADGDPAWRRLAAAAAAIVIAADVCGSAVIVGQQDPAAWAGVALATVCSGRELAAVADRSLAGRPLRPFQANVEASLARLTLVTAGCGTGKTAAAYRWAARRGAGRKLFFCYPTTGTASEGFLHYAHPELGADARLVHSRAAADIVAFLGNGSEETASTPNGDIARFRGLWLWGAKVTVCTVDTVLGLLQHHRTGTFAFPALANAAFVFDEVHLYDDRLFGTLLAFLEAFRGSPALLMTATLQPGRREALRTLAERLEEQLVEIAGPADFEKLPRYLIATADVDGARQQAFDAVKAGQRVLWVVNTVERAVTLGQEAERAKMPVELYHSRYRYDDRLARHRAVVGRFRPGARGGVLAVTTQVCEVSLDISADLLVTELADVPALIQRLGRLNRWATPGSGARPCPALVLEPPQPAPYTQEALARARRWLASLAGKPASQTDLAAAFGEVDPGDVSRRARAAWLDEAWALEPTALREPGTTVPVIREEDLPACLDKAGRVRSESLELATIPMLWGPVAREAALWRTVRGVLVAPRGRVDYDKRWGATWRR